MEAAHGAAAGGVGVGAESRGGAGGLIGLLPSQLRPPLPLLVEAAAVAPSTSAATPPHMGAIVGQLPPVRRRISHHQYQHQHNGDYHHHNGTNSSHAGEGNQSTTSSTTTATGSSKSRGNPIDHIFQFHKAIRIELEQLEQAACRLVEVAAQQAEAGSGESDEQVEESQRHFAGRFHFLWGMYRAHSNAEDEIVFPALEAKEALHNVSHSYVLDHKQEEQLFENVSQLLTQLKLSSTHVEEQGGGPSLPPSHRLAMLAYLPPMCAAIRVSLDRHVGSEERELWPLFSTHFTIGEQEDIVGQIVGHTGAEVLQAMLPFVTTALTDEEQVEMMDSILDATRHTSFDQWLSAWWRNQSDTSADGTTSKLTTIASAPSYSEPIKDIANYLAMSNGGVDPMDCDEQAYNSRTAGDEPGVSPAGSLREAGFKPGWQDIFRMNQRELEAAIRRVSNDPLLDPKRKAYLMQNLMASRWIVAQQKHNAESESMLKPDAMKTWRDKDKGILGCSHYARSCRLVAACCGKVVTCRFCHDETSNHQMNRQATTHMVCMHCGVRQPVQQHCATPTCGKQMARYYCSICKFFDDDSSREIYHCPFCNLCRVGKGLGVDAFHCMSCNACMSLSLRNHQCRERSLESDCPICHDYLFTSKQPVKALRCGHFMHSTCFQARAYTKEHYTCPVCSKSLGDMTVYFRMLDALLATEQLPDEYRSRTQNILCNDCEMRGTAPFHFVYFKCTACGSYNTRPI
eukprot:jgi/Chlat1/6945/Chrsp52S06613